MKTYASEKKGRKSLILNAILLQKKFCDIFTYKMIIDEIIEQFNNKNEKN